MKIHKVCFYISNVWNVLPPVVITPKEKGFIIAIKFLRLHAGVYLMCGDEGLPEEDFENLENLK